MQWAQESGFLSNPMLSHRFRIVLQQLCRYRQFCDVEEAIGKYRGDTAQWNVYGDVLDQGDELDENAPMPETEFGIGQGNVRVTEFGNSVPYNGKLEDLSEHNYRKIVFGTLKRDCNKTLDRKARAQFDNGLLNYVATGAAAATITDDGTLAAVNNSPLNLYHVKAIADYMEERDIPVFDGENYMCVARPSTMRPFKDELEELHKYTGEGYMKIVNGEVGRYEGIRFVKQTNINTEGWSNGASDAAHFFGADTVTEAIACAEEIRAAIGGDYGRAKGLAWYYLGNFGITHADASTAETRAQSRILKFASAS